MASKTIRINYDKKEYILEYNRSTARLTETRGFNAGQIDSKPATMLPLLFEGAFLAHHSNIKKKVVEDIFEQLGDKGKLIGKLLEMYMETVNSLMDSTEDNEKNAGWEASWTEE